MEKSRIFFINFCGRHLPSCCVFHYNFSIFHFWLRFHLNPFEKLESIKHLVLYIQYLSKSRSKSQFCWQIHIGNVSSTATREFFVTEIQYLCVFIVFEKCEDFGLNAIKSLRCCYGFENVEWTRIQGNVVHRLYGSKPKWRIQKSRKWL